MVAMAALDQVTFNACPWARSTRSPCPSPGRSSAPPTPRRAFRIGWWCTACAPCGCAPPSAVPASACPSRSWRHRFTVVAWITRATGGSAQRPAGPLPREQRRQQSPDGRAWSHHALWIEPFIYNFLSMPCPPCRRQKCWVLSQEYGRRGRFLTAYGEFLQTRAGKMVVTGAPEQIRNLQPVASH
jgi:hypothetical protein